MGGAGYGIGGSDLCVRIRESSRKLHQWVTLDNCVELAKRGMAKIGATNVNLISIDLDGNDFFFVKAILEQG